MRLVIIDTYEPIIMVKWDQIQEEEKIFKIPTSNIKVINKLIKVYNQVLREDPETIFLSVTNQLVRWHDILENSLSNKIYLKFQLLDLLINQILKYATSVNMDQAIVQGANLNKQSLKEINRFIQFGRRKEKDHKTLFGLFTFLGFTGTLAMSPLLTRDPGDSPLVITTTALLGGLFFIGACGLIKLRKNYNNIATTMEEKISQLITLHPLPVFEDKLENYPVNFVSLEEEPLLVGEYDRALSSILADQKSNSEEDCLTCAICKEVEMLEKDVEEAHVAVSIETKDEPAESQPHNESQLRNQLYKSLAYTVTKGQSLGSLYHVPCLSFWIVPKLTLQTSPKIKDPGTKKLLNFDQFNCVKLVSILEILRHYENSKQKYPLRHPSSTAGTASSSIGPSSSTTSSAEPVLSSSEKVRIKWSKYPTISESLNAPLLSPGNGVRPE